MTSQQDINKRVVARFNHEVIAQGRTDVCDALVAEDFVNRSAPPGSDAGLAGMLHTFNDILRPAFPDLAVDILDQVAEGDKVVTRKRITGTHRGALMGVPPTDRAVGIDVIDIVRLRDGRYVEHWGVNTFAVVAAQLKAACES